MTFDIAGLKASGQGALERAGKRPRQLVMLYALVAGGVGLLCSLLGWVLSRQMDTATGLSGLGTRSALMAAQTVVSIVVAVASPLWDAGYMVTMLDVYRGKETGPRRLLWGFVQWKRMLVCGVFLLLQMFVMSYLALMVSEMVYMLSPFSASLDLTVVEQALVTGDASAVYRRMLPMLILAAVAVCAVVVYLLFRYQLVYYIMEDYPDIPGRRLLGASAVLIRGMKGQFFRLYLSYWWYFVLCLVGMVIPYLDVLLELAGIRLPVNGDLLAAGLYAVYLVFTCGVQILWKNQVQCSLAAAYTRLREERMSETKA